MIKAISTFIQQFAAALLAMPIVVVIWVLAGPPPLEIFSMELADKATKIRRGSDVVFRMVTEKPWWSVKFCTAQSGTMNMVDSSNIIRQSALAGVNSNDGKIYRDSGVLLSVMITGGTALGVESFQVVTVYECFGFSRTVRGPIVKYPIVE